MATVNRSSFASESLDALRMELKGDALVAGDSAFDDRRRVWNGMIDRTPAVIARCTCVEDVQAAIRFARAEGLDIAVRGGGHSAAGLATCDDGIVIDLSGMRSVVVDPATRTARAEGGATWGDFDAATQAHGLATTGGAISTTGIGGLTLGGGIGWLMRKHGLASDNVLAFELVTAEGDQITASADDHPELYWALRGGGGNFGVVTAFTYRLHPVDTILGGLLIHPAMRAGELLRYYRDVTERASDDLTVFAALMSSPDGDPISAMALCHQGAEPDAGSETQPMRDFGPPLVDDVTRKPYRAHQQMLDEGFPAGLQVYWKAGFLTALPDAAIDTLVDRFASITSPLSAILIEHMGGAVARQPDHATAFAYRQAPYNLAFISRWTDPAEADRHTGWTREIFAAMEPWMHGVYLNYLGTGDDASRVRDAFDSATYARLASVKARYDPENLFARNHNIAPVATG